jgi:hypothetical protein
MLLSLRQERLPKATNLAARGVSQRLVGVGAGIKQIGSCHAEEPFGPCLHRNSRPLLP